MKRIVLIACSKSKQSCGSYAKDMYISPLFRLSLQYAYLNLPDVIFILSAKYGLLGLEDLIEPYEETLNTITAVGRREWSRSVLRQLDEQGVDLHKDHFIFLGGVKYRQYLTPKMSYCSIPLEGLGIGYQLQKLKQLTGTPTYPCLSVFEDSLKQCEEECIRPSTCKGHGCNDDCTCELCHFRFMSCCIFT